MQELPYERMQEICAGNSDLNREFQKYRLLIIKDGKPIPLDYIMVLPKIVTRDLYRETKFKLEKQKKDVIEEIV